MLKTPPLLALPIVWSGQGLGLEVGSSERHVQVVFVISLDIRQVQIDGFNRRVQIDEGKLTGPNERVQIGRSK
jgi:hypothetical protein